MTRYAIRQAAVWLLFFILLFLGLRSLLMEPFSARISSAVDTRSPTQVVILVSGLELAEETASPVVYPADILPTFTHLAGEEARDEPPTVEHPAVAAVAASTATATAATTATPVATLTLIPSSTPTLALPTPAPWDRRERVTILVLGVDAREGESGGGPPRTDTMILLTIDPVAKTAGMLSIPRDLWVVMPATDKSARINVAYRWGEQARLPGGGAGYAIRAVSELMGVPIHYYLLLDFKAFTGFIDALGGLKMHIREEIKVDPVGPGNTVMLEPGVQTLSGPVVLGYARNRYTQRGDFDRIDRQHEVILAVREQVLSLKMLPLLVYEAPAIYKSISNGIESNLALDQMIRLAWLASQVEEENIRRAAFTSRDLSSELLETEIGPQDVLILKPERIPALRTYLLGSPKE
jgi:LCP family protein required for cell wall assembly